MANPIVTDLPFSERIELREKVLAWISRDVGIQEFLIPDELTTEWSEAEKSLWTTTVIDRFIRAKTNPFGKAARSRVLARENAGWVRRGCVAMQQDLADHRLLTRTAVLLEALWNEVSASLSDLQWAECSIMFDSALISLRVAYVWLYDKIENEDADLESRKQTFTTVVDSFFGGIAPTDDRTDKHSSNFRDLQRVWRTEFDKYTTSDDFGAKLERLQETHNLIKVAAAVGRFMSAINVDPSWMWEMKQLDDDVKAGYVKRKRKQRKGPELPPEPPEPDSSESFEPHAADSDFDIEIAEKVAASPDNDIDEDMSASSDDLMRGSMSQRRNNGTEVRRSMRVAQAKAHRFRPSREDFRGRHKRAAAKRAALRFSHSPSPSGSDEPLRVRAMKHNPKGSYEDDEEKPTGKTSADRRTPRYEPRTARRRGMGRTGISRSRVTKEKRTGPKGRRRTSRLLAKANDRERFEDEAADDYADDVAVDPDEMVQGLAAHGSNVTKVAPEAPISFPNRRSRLAAMLG
ncbi:hypothetical protein BWQ96_09705 [Gracilariopsis chorda]|uniref:Uncharacterized protein n=1 Tax=Gracilariopsis chorda TaxID=448386 RepID=A0A2V3IEX7_9FLOR|nr:hypothetical protein BWQ96_09705 [Gracilariopsis chorda]|eukprot:PXF40601.1 hypothetical protein BWQ96_09705 [Gracilariopsis chorda]